MSLERYRSVVADWPRFVAAMDLPEPTHLRVQANRCDLHQLRELLEGQGFVLETEKNLPGFLRVAEEPYSAGQTLEHWLGLYYIQQAATGVAARALQPRPGERILDLCAAPGGKTTHLSDLMGERGTLVSVDVSEKRLRGLLGNVYRAGQLNVMAVAADARHLPKGVLFDRVLVDAPCTAEGNQRGRGERAADPDPEFREYISGVQEAILRRAVDLTRPGGTILYVTCTFAPEENERVVSRVMEDRGLVVEPIPLDLPHDPGLTSFELQDFHPSLERAWRIYPHHLDSGGLFLVRLRRTEDDTGDGGWAPTPPVFPGDGTLEGEAWERVEEGIELLASSFGVEERELRSLRWIVRGDSLWAHGADHFPTAWDEARDRRFLSLGVRALKADGRGRLRPTNDFLRRLGPRVASRVLDLNPARCLQLLRGGSVDAPGLSRGFVALRVEDHVVGRGLSGSQGVRSEVPKARSRRLRDVLEIRLRGREDA